MPLPLWCPASIRWQCLTPQGWGCCVNDPSACHLKSIVLTTQTHRFGERVIGSGEGKPGKIRLRIGAPAAKLTHLLPISLNC